MKQSFNMSKQFNSSLVILASALLLFGCSAKDNTTDNKQSVESTSNSSQAQSVPAAKPVLDAGYLALFEKSKEMVAESLARNPKNFRAPQHYVELPQRQVTQSGNEVIEIAEFFSYGCPACFNAEPSMQAYESQLASDVRFVRIPVSFNPSYELLARAYYSANALGASEEAHVALFDALHVKRQRLATEKSLAGFFAAYGVDQDKFLKTLHSFSVNAQIERDKKLAANYQVSGVPTVIVNGKYNTGGQKAGSMDVWMQILDTLTERERALSK